MEKQKISFSILLLTTIGAGYFFIMGLIDVFLSSYISSTVGSTYLSIVYLFAYFFLILFAFFSNKILIALGPWYTLCSHFLVVSLGIIFLLYGNTVLILFGLLLYLGTYLSQKFVFDWYFELLSSKKDTGKIRGRFLSLSNLFLILGLFFTGYLSNFFSQEIFFLIAILFSALLFLASIIFLRIDKKTVDIQKSSTIREIIQHIKSTSLDIKKVIILNGLLEFFYASMWIFVPLYLHGTIGLEWKDISYIIAIAIIPFVIIDLFAGKLADTRFGEKEMMNIGLVIMSLGVMSISIYEGNSFWIWMGCMIFARAGAALFEIMLDTYFFKTLEKSSLEITTLYRSFAPFMRFILSLFSLFALSFFPLQGLIFAISLVLLLGIVLSLTIKDTDTYVLNEGIKR